MYEKYSKIRDSRGMNDYAVSKASGVSTATLTCWKQGRYTPKLDKLQAIARVLNCSILDFLEEP